MSDPSRWTTRLSKVSGIRVAPSAQGNKSSAKVILQYAAIAFIIVSSIGWTIVTIDFIRNAPEYARRACAGQNIWSGGSDAYYWCLQRVTAGGKP